MNIYMVDLILNEIDDLAYRIEDEFIHSSTAQEVFDEIRQQGQSLWDFFTESRTNSYQRLSKHDILNFDKLTAKNIATCFSLAPFSVSEQQPFRSSYTENDLTSKRLRERGKRDLDRVRNYYQMQKTIKYANCQNQAIFLDLLIQDKISNYNSNVKSMICTISQPCHAFNLIFIQDEYNDHQLYLYDAWSGIKRNYLGVFNISRLDIQSYHNYCYLNDPLSENKKRLLVQICESIMLSYGKLFGIDSTNDIERNAEQIDLSYSDYLLNYLNNFNDAQNYYSYGLNPRDFYYHYCINNKKQDWVNKYVNKLSNYIIDRRGNNKNFKDLFHSGYSKESKINAALELKKLLEGNPAKIKKFKSELTNGNLGKIFKSMCKDISLKDDFSRIEWLCYNSKNDIAVTENIDIYSYL